MLAPVVVFLITTYLARWVLDREDSKQNQRLESKVRKRLKKAVERRTEELRDVYEDSSDESDTSEEDLPAIKHEEQELPGTASACVLFCNQ